MRVAGLNQKKSLPARVGALVAIAIALGFAVWTGWHAKPSTDDASIDADVIHVSAAVAGRIIKLPVHENELVHKGDLLFQIDPVPYEQTVDLMAANVELARAALGTQHRIVSTQRSNAVIASEQIPRAEANYGLTQRTEQRLRPLTDKGYVPQQQLDQAQIAMHDADTSRRQAHEQASAAKTAIDTVAGAEAALSAAQAALAQAQRALADTAVYAEHEGRVVGLSVASGERVLPSQALFTLVITEEWFAIANLRETELQAVAVGDCATVYSMVDRGKALRGRVESVGWGVVADDRINLPRSVPYVRPSLNWVRVAQRFPVRIKLEAPPVELMRLGASASVELHHGRSCT